MRAQQTSLDFGLVTKQKPRTSQPSETKTRLVCPILWQLSIALFQETARQNIRNRKRNWASQKEQLWRRTAKRNSREHEKVIIPETDSIQKRLQIQTRLLFSKAYLLLHAR